MELIPLKTVEGRIISRHGLLILITSQGTGYLLTRNPELKEAFDKVKESANKDVDLTLYGKDTGKIRTFEHIQYREGKKTAIQREKYKVLEVFLVKSVTTPSKITQADIEKTITLKILDKKGPLPSSMIDKSEKDSTSNSNYKGESVVNSHISAPPSTSSHSSPILPRTPQTPMTIAEIEGEVVSINLEHKPMPIIVIKGGIGGIKETVTIAIPKGAGVIKNSREAQFNDIKIGDTVDIWYMEMGDQNIGQMISIVKPE